MTMPTEAPPWRQLEQQLADPSCFDRLLEQEEEMESKASDLAERRLQRSASGNAQVRWLQRTLNRVSAFGIAENGVPSVKTKRALQKFQTEQGLRPTGSLGPKTRAALIRSSGMPAPRPGAEDDGDALEAEMEAPSGRCPADNPNTVSGFNRYSDDIKLLPDDQQKKLTRIALEINNLANALPHGLLDLPDKGPMPQVLVIGHADVDAARESQEPGFLQFLSEKRAAAVRSELCRRLPLSLVARLSWIEVGVGASALVVSPARNETERRCNRRVEIRLSPKGEPELNEKQFNKTDIDFHGPGSFTEYYDIALQGTSGQYEKPQVAEQQAREIALRAVSFLKPRTQETAPACAPYLGIQSAFKDALQGTASKFSDPDVVVSKAYDIAQRAQFGSFRALRKLQWQHALLPKPMSPDCVMVRGKVPGPANYVLCGTHGHILDITSRTVIAHDLDEYKKQPRR
jgi:outer membrane protein OmpA-like peptidoglycan-associated protein